MYRCLRLRLCKILALGISFRRLEAIRIFRESRRFAARAGVCERSAWTLIRSFRRRPACNGKQRDGSRTRIAHVCTGYCQATGNRPQSAHLLAYCSNCHARVPRTPAKNAVRISATGGGGGDNQGRNQSGHEARSRLFPLSAAFSYWRLR